MKNNEELEQLSASDNTQHKEFMNFSKDNPVYPENQYFSFENKKIEEFATDCVFIKEEEKRQSPPTPTQENATRLNNIKAITANVSSIVTTFMSAAAAVIIVITSIIAMATFPVKYNVEYELFPQCLEFRINVDGEEGYESYAHLYTEDRSFETSYPLLYGENFVNVQNITQNSKYYFEIVCLKLDSEDKQVFEKIVIDVPKMDTFDVDVPETDVSQEINKFEIIFLETFENSLECKLMVNTPAQITSYVYLVDMTGRQKQEMLTSGENIFWFDDLMSESEYTLIFVTIDSETGEEIICKTMRVKTNTTMSTF